MDWREIKIRFSYFLGYIILLLIFLLPLKTLAMSSSDYQINADSINFLGLDSASTNYNLNDTGGEVATGDSTSTHYQDRAGYWPMVMDYHISISTPGTVTMGAISGHGQSNLATNSATFVVNTDNPAGYSLSWHASAATMSDGTGDSIAAYTPGTPSVPEVWSVAGADSEWGGHLGASSTTVDTSFWGAADTYAGGKWLNIATSNFQIASRATRTGVGGDSEIVFFGAEVGNSHFQPSGTYTVNVTVTATTL